MKIIIIGPPNSGKGTQAQYISKQYKIPQISIGNMLRNIIKKDKKIGKYVKKRINNGKLVKNKIVISLIKKRIKKKDCKNGYLLDGFPRNLDQAKMMKLEKIKINYVIQLKANTKTILNRAIGRKIHLKSGRIYHDVFNPPIKKNCDDITGESLIVRKDDKINILKKRIIEYKKINKPLILFFKKKQKKKKIILFTINSEKKIKLIKKKIKKFLEKKIIKF
ncbi:nucleoside monophosphate kinase [Buchnera aphidicola]|uniref:adenylate kinase family protein n=1 Tax=Buchnera aphidicola TaxID=9 RepID=UPI0030EB2E67